MMALSRQQKIDILLCSAIFIFAMALRFAYLWQIYPIPFFFHPVIDARMYDLWAQNIAHGAWLWNDIPFQAPGYAYFLAFIYLSFGFNYTAPLLLQAAMGSLTCVFVYLIARRLFSRLGIVAAALAGLCAACYWTLIYFDGQLISECLAMFLGFAGLWVIVRTRDLCEQKELVLFQVSGLRFQVEGRHALSGQETRPLGQKPETRNLKPETQLTLAHWFLGGLLMGLSAATRPNIVPFLPFAALWALGFPRQAPKELARRMRLRLYRLVAAVVLVVGVLLPVGAITWRNYAVSGAFFPIQWNTAINFYIGNNAQSTGMPSVREGSAYNRLRDWPASEGCKGQVEQAQFFIEKAKEFMRESPGAWSQLVLKKFVLFWNSFEIGDIQDIYYWRFWSPLLRLPLPGFEVVGPIGLIGLILLLPHWRRLFLLYALLASNLVALMIFTVSARYRLMAVPVLVCFAAAMLVQLGRWAAERKWVRLAVAAVLLAAGTFLVNYDFYDVSSTRIFRRHYHLGMVCVETSKSETDPEEYKKKLLLAVEEFKSELELNPGDVDVLHALGTTYLSLNAYDLAYTALKEAMDDQPDHVDVYVAMGNLYEKMRRLPDAAGEYEEAIRLNPDCFEAYNNLGHVLNLQSRHEEAMEYLTKAAELRPASPDPLNNLGIALVGLKKVAEAIAMYERAIERDPRSASLHYNLACAYFMEGRNAEARVEAQMAQALGHPRAEALLGKIKRAEK